jgi:hypothetical protein
MKLKERQIAETMFASITNKRSSSRNLFLKDFNLVQKAKVRWNAVQLFMFMEIL